MLLCNALLFFFFFFGGFIYIYIVQILLVGIQHHVRLWVVAGCTLYMQQGTKQQVFKPAAEVYSR